MTAIKCKRKKENTYIPKNIRELENFHTNKLYYKIFIMACFDNFFLAK